MGHGWDACIPKHAEDEPRRVGEKSDPMFFDGGKNTPDLGADRHSPAEDAAVDAPSEILREARRGEYERMSKEAGEMPPWMGKGKDDDDKPDKKKAEGGNPFADKDDDDDDDKDTRPPWMKGKEKKAEDEFLAALRG